MSKKAKPGRKNIDAEKAYNTFNQLVDAIRNAHRSRRRWMLTSLVVFTCGVISTLWASGLLDGL